MTMPAFTPGPWTLDKTGIRLFAIEASSARVSICFAPDSKKGLKNWEQGNVRLIAAAPDMYQALHHLHVMGGLDANSKRLVSDALAKARGEP